MSLGGPLRGAEGSPGGLFHSLRSPTRSPDESGSEERELFVRRVRKEGRPLLALRAIDLGGACIVEAHVFPEAGSADPVYPGPYRFSSVERGSAFVRDALEALLYLGCEIETPEAQTDESEPARAAAEL